MTSTLDAIVKLVQGFDLYGRYNIKTRYFLTCPSQTIRTKIKKKEKKTILENTKRLYIL